MGTLVVGTAAPHCRQQLALPPPELCIELFSEPVPWLLRMRLPRGSWVPAVLRDRLLRPMMWHFTRTTEFVEDVLLITSEGVTNCIRHAVGSTFEIEVCRSGLVAHPYLAFSLANDAALTQSQLNIFLGHVLLSDDPSRVGQRGLIASRRVSQEHRLGFATEYHASSRRLGRCYFRFRVPILDLSHAFPAN